MKGIAPVLLLCLLSGTSLTLADGSTPPRPYRYLNPPKALRSVNKKPLPGSHTYRLDGHRRTPSIILFTRDHQAGIGAHAGAVVFGSPAQRGRLTIAPVRLRHGLPGRLRADGNVYDFSLAGIPGGGAGVIRQAVGLVLAWPHRPKAIYRYDGRRWQKACGPSRWSVSPGIVFCNVRKLGNYVAVR